MIPRYYHLSHGTYYHFYITNNVLRIPLHQCKFNAIELIWAQAKGTTFEEMVIQMKMF